MFKWVKNKLSNIQVYELLLLIFIPCIILLYYGWEMDVDIWFILNVGRYIYANGFPHTEIFTMHEGLNYVVQQWAYAVVVWPVFKWIGPLGIFIINQIMNVILYFLLYKLCMVVSDKNKKLSLIFSTLIFSLLAYSSFITLRPHMITYICLVSTLIIWEKYIKNGNWKILLLLPLVSIINSNFHAAMWWMIIIYSLPFIAEVFIRQVIKKEKKLNVDVRIMIIILCITFMCGCINPYGIDAITYLTKTGNPYVSGFISEMHSTTIFSKIGIIIILTISIYIIYIANVKKNDFKIRHFFLLIGSTILGFSALKCGALFILGALYPLCYYCRKLKFGKDISFRKQSLLYKIIYIVFIVFMCIFIILWSPHRLSFKERIYNSDRLIELKEKIGTENVTLYINYNRGSFAEYIGFKCYIDSRAEVFYKSMNEKADIFNEYYELQNGMMDVNEFLDKYKFTHLYIDFNDYIFMFRDLDNYHIIDERGDYRIYERDDYNES